MNLLWSLDTSSQTLLHLDKDTLICFSIPQSRVILKKLYEGERDSILLHSCITREELIKGVVIKDSLIIHNKTLVIDSLKKNQSILLKQNNTLQEENINLSTKMQRRTRQRNALFFSTLSLLLLSLFILK